MPLIDPEVAAQIERLELPFNQYGLDPYGIDKGYLRGFFSFLNFFYSKWLTVDAYGLENVPDRGRAMIVGNHSGGIALDGGMIIASLMLSRSRAWRKGWRGSSSTAPFALPSCRGLVSSRACQSAVRLWRTPASDGVPRRGRAPRALPPAELPGPLRHRVHPPRSPDRDPHRPRRSSAGRPSHGGEPVPPRGACRRALRPVTLIAPLPRPTHCQIITDLR